MHDTHGNVWEWVWDWYNDRSYDGNRSSDPLGPPSGEQRVTRGGSWGSDAKFCRSASRDSAIPNKRTNTIGFRLAMTAEASAPTGIGEPPKAAPVSAQVAPAPAGSNVPPAPAAFASVPPPPTATVNAAAALGAAPAAPGPTAYVPPSGDSMTFGKAVSTCLKKFADFSGRASRAEFWFFFLFNFLLGFSVAFILAFAGADDHTINVACGVVVLTMLLPSYAVTVRRLHDTGRSAWFLLIFLIPGIGLITWTILMLLEGEPGSNRFG